MSDADSPDGGYPPAAGTPSGSERGQEFYLRFGYELARLIRPGEGEDLQGLGYAIADMFLTFAHDPIDDDDKSWEEHLLEGMGLDADRAVDPAEFAARLYEHPVRHQLEAVLRAFDEYSRHEDDLYHPMTDEEADQLVREAA